MVCMSSYEVSGPEVDLMQEKENGMGEGRKQETEGLVLMMLL